MEEAFEAEELRDRLILAGILEIEAHGLTDFSLRRVASACGASCAAPYKHFKNKDALLLEILRFINSQWVLLEEQLIAIYGDDPRRLLTELCIANIRFRVANPHFRAVLMLDGQALSAVQRQEIDRPMAKIVALTATVYGAAALQKQYMLRSLVYGAAVLIGRGEYPNTPETMAMVRDSIGKIALAF